MHDEMACCVLCAANRLTARLLVSPSIACRGPLRLVGTFIHLQLTMYSMLQNIVGLRMNDAVRCDSGSTISGSSLGHYICNIHVAILMAVGLGRFIVRINKI